MAAVPVWGRRVWPLVVLCAIVAIVAELGALGSVSLDRTVVTMLINLIVVVGLSVFIGNSGVYSFGHVSFMAIGAYTTGIATIPPERKEVLLPDLPGFLAGFHLDSVSAVLVAGAVAMGVAAVLAVPLMRLSGLVAALATFAVLLIVNVVAKNWEAVTNGTSGMSAIPVTTTVERALVWALVALVLAFAFKESRLGRRLQASRDDELAARSIGIGVGLERGVAFLLSAFLCGIAGALFAQSVGSIAPDSFFLALTFLTIAMLVVGGISSLAGAVVGTIVISALSEFLRRIETGFDVGSVRVDGPAGLEDLGLGFVMLLILLLRPGGITGGLEIRWPFGSWQTMWRDRFLRPEAGTPERQG